MVIDLVFEFVTNFLFDFIICVIINLAFASYVDKSVSDSNNSPIRKMKNIDLIREWIFLKISEGREKEEYHDVDAYSIDFRAYFSSSLLELIEHNSIILRKFRFVWRRLYIDSKWEFPRYYYV